MEESPAFFFQNKPPEARIAPPRQNTIQSFYPARAAPEIRLLSPRQTARCTAEYISGNSSPCALNAFLPYPYSFQKKRVSEVLTPSDLLLAKNLYQLLLKERCIRCCIVCLNHIDCECIILAWITKTVCNVRLCLTITTNVFNL